MNIDVGLWKTKDDTMTSAMRWLTVAHRDQNEDGVEQVVWSWIQR